MALLLLLCALAQAELWDGSFSSPRFVQRYRVEQDGSIWAECEVEINAAPSKVWHELARGDWSFWRDGEVALHPEDLPDGGKRRIVLGDYALFSAVLWLNISTEARIATGSLSGIVTGPVSLEVLPHPTILLRTVLVVKLRGGVRSSWIFGKDLLARSLLWACRGDLTWFPRIHGFSGLIRTMEGYLGWKYDLVEDVQLEALANSSEIWASTMDSADDRPAVLAQRPVSLRQVLASVPVLDPKGLPKDDEAARAFLQFGVHFDSEFEEQDNEYSFRASHGWNIRNNVKISLLEGNDDAARAPLSFVISESSDVSLRIRVGEDAHNAVQIALGSLPPSPPAVLRLVTAVFQSNWTCVVTLGEGETVRVLIPEQVRDDLVLENIIGVELQSNRRAILRHVLLTEDPKQFAQIQYFSSRRSAAERDAHLLSSSGGDAAGSRLGIPTLSWSAVSSIVLLLVGLPLAVARVASFDSLLMPKKGFDMPLLYFRLAPSATGTHIAAASCVGICFLLSLVLHFPGSIPSLAYVLTAHTPEALLWRIAASVLTLQRVMEAYLGFKTYIDKLTEKSFRVAFPLFDLHYWLWMNRVSLVANVMASVSLLVVSLSSPFSSANLQQAGLAVFGVCHVVHLLSHFATFAQIKRSYHETLLSRLRTTLNAAVALLAARIAFRELYVRTGLSGCDQAAVLSEWGFFGIYFFWHQMMQREFIAPEDTRLYVGRRIALGASTRCSECFRPFSRSRTRETCADCRDECCIDCGTEVHLSELGSMLDVMCFFCSKCNQLLQAEVAAARNKQLHVVKASPRVAGETSSRGSGLSSGASGSMELCKEFQRGECNRGEFCKFVHATPRRRNTATTGAAKKTTPPPAAVANPAPAVPPALAATPAPAVAVATTATKPVSPNDNNSDSGMSSGVESGILSDSNTSIVMEKDSSSTIERKKGRRRGHRGQGKNRRAAAANRGGGHDGGGNPAAGSQQTEWEDFQRDFLMKEEEHVDDE